MGRCALETSCLPYHLDHPRAATVNARSLCHNVAGICVHNHKVNVAWLGKGNKQPACADLSCIHEDDYLAGVLHELLLRVGGHLPLREEAQPSLKPVSTEKNLVYVCSHQ